MILKQTINNYLVEVQLSHQCVIFYNWESPKYRYCCISKIFNNATYIPTILYLSGDDNSSGSFNNNLLRGVLLKTIELLLKLEQPDFVGVS